MKTESEDVPETGGGDSADSAGRPRAPLDPRARWRALRDYFLKGPPRRRRAFWLAVGAVVAITAAFTWFVRFTEIDFAEINGRATAAIGKLSPAAILPLMALLPVVGFPIMFVYLIAGARFGPVMGGVVVAGVTAVHLIATYAIARSFLRAPLQRWIERRHRKLPQVPDDEAAGVALVAALAPGLPYVVRNYVLALAGVKFRVYFWVCLPVYVARSYVTIMLGDLSSDPSRNGLLIIVAIDVLKVAICAFVLWKLREHHRRFHGHAPERPAPPSGAAP